MHKVVIGDCRQIMKRMREKSVHLVVTSPPYNLGINYSDWNDSMPIEEYREFVKEWLSDCHRVLVDGGRICVNVPIFVYKMNRCSLLFEYYNLMKQVGFSDREVILWVKRRESDNRFVAKQKLYGTVKDPTNPLLRYVSEAIVVMNKNGGRLGNDVGSRPDMTDWEFRHWSYNVWEFDTEMDRTHPAPFPEELPKRLIKLYSFAGQTVLDPFLGSGTTTKVARDLKRNSIGIELSRDYIPLIEKKLGHSDDYDIVAIGDVACQKVNGETRTSGFIDERIDRPSDPLVDGRIKDGSILPQILRMCQSNSKAIAELSRRLKETGVGQDDYHYVEA